ncbi:glycosyltransferase [Lachnospiraceae bacterium 56-18]
MSRISVVIPCFNEEEALPLYYREMCRVMGEMSGEEFELIFVDDGSSDRTLSILKPESVNHLGEKFPESLKILCFW